ncbi:MAG: hypothetical protein QM791_21570 [Ferruginibacter sp.]
MKKLALTIVTFLLINIVSAQLKATPVCPAFVVDILEGTISSKVDCTSTAGEVKKFFPCFTEAKEDSTNSGCGGVFFKDKDISFFTSRGYIEIGENFKGKLEPALIGVSRSNLFSLLGNPVIKDPTWDAFKTSYGLLVLYYNSTGKINKLQFTNKSAETLKLCE